MSDSACAALLEAREHDPFSVLGLHAEGAGWRLRVFRPHAKAVAVELANGEWAPLKRRSGRPVRVAGRDATAPAVAPRYRRREAIRCLRLCAAGRRPTTCTCSMPGACARPGALRCGAGSRDGIAGVCFRVWAPNAERVSVVGDFNGWDGRVHPDGHARRSGVWELFVPELAAGALYRFELRLRGSGALKLKSDPYARAFERRPATACCVTPDRRTNGTTALDAGKRSRRATGCRRR
jgi:1,4-alpha-glucan branching enzyme